ncbi:MAG: hypothetical protein K0S09_1870 [Sphingobacteriaceae bacterium]|jgi:hypothetical protein|nr:hypothetical protein [Sphingobacteriaceae bacterium]
MLALFAALIANTASAQYNSSRNENGTYSTRNNSNQREQIISRTDDPNVYTDQGGQYHWQTVEKRVWIDTYEKSTLFGKKTVPGHYEVVTDRLKIYHNGSQYNQNGQYDNGQKQPGWAGKHPHGMPPGQRKKVEGNGNYGSGDYDRNGKYDRDSKSKKHDKDRDDDDRDNDWNGRNRNENRQ